MDGSYAMGYIDILFNAISGRIRNPTGSISGLARRFGRHFIHQWWRHATQDDLREAHIYDAIRADVAWSLKHRLRDLTAGDGAMSLLRGATMICLIKRTSALA